MKASTISTDSYFDKCEIPANKRFIIRLILLFCAEIYALPNSTHTKIGKPKSCNWVKIN